MTIEFQSFGKIPRLSRECIITEKLDGTNAQIIITEDGEFGCASRKRLITPEDDNFGFASWAYANKEILMNLGPGRHFGEWWGHGIQCGYGLGERRFSLFNVGRWGWLNTCTPEQNPLAGICSAVPTIYSGKFTTEAVDWAMDILRKNGSKASPGFMQPEGVIVYHTAANQYFKKTFKHDEEGKPE